MNLQKLRDQLVIDEGIRYSIYLDTKGLPTCGIGHLIVKGDEEYGKPVGTKITEERCFELFDNDIKSVLVDCQRLFIDFLDFPEELKQIIANMMFNLGLPRLRGFKKFVAAVKEKDLIVAAWEMKDSVWYRQVKGRAERLCKRMIALANCNVEYAKF